jgi:cold-inducible RNA-binding protein
MDICVGNLPRDLTARDLRDVFESFGRVDTVDVVRRRHGEQSQGWGFVGMPAREEAVSAVLGIHGKTVNGQALTANEVQPRGPVSGACGTRCLCRAANQPGGNAHHSRAESRREGEGDGTGANELEEGPAGTQAGPVRSRSRHQGCFHDRSTGRGI